MSKKMNRINDLDPYEDYNEAAYQQSLKEHRKMKRMKNAIRSKNIDDLMRDIDDDYDFY